MSNIIQLLPDAIANQIAAGEVIQRPASVVKELMENAIDAQASDIKLFIKDAGKTLVQVTDNGNGMSDTDARISIERHATSKIRESADLFRIRTKGFRGEALASIAAVSQMEIKTRQEGNEVGTRVRVKASSLIEQDLCQTPVGTNIIVKNLFFNVPARRRFLKSNAVEMRHIMDEFKRLAIAHPDLRFSLYHDDKEIYILREASLKKRIIDLFGDKLETRLIPIQEETPEVSISGYVGTPESARKSMPDQFFFVNDRFIRSGYLNHAINLAFEGLLPEGYRPAYFIFFEVDPKFIDVNIHPTKEEIKFEDQQLMYQYLRAAIRYGLGKHNITPSLDFDKDAGLDDTLAIHHQGDKKPGGSTGSSRLPDFPRKADGDDWKQFYETLYNTEDEGDDEPLTLDSQMDQDASTEQEKFEPTQIHNSYIVAQIKTGMIVIDQQKAHERILYERFLNASETGIVEMQQLLFPEQIDLSADQLVVLKEILPELKKMGFEVNPFGQGTYIIHAVPSMLSGKGDIVNIIEALVEEVSADRKAKNIANEIIAQSLAVRLSMNKGKKLTVDEMRGLIEQLFACETPYVTPRGKACFFTLTMNDLESKFS